MYDASKEYSVQQAIDAAGRLQFTFMADSLADAQTFAQSIATLTGVKVQLHSKGRANAGTFPASYAYTPGSQGTTVSSPSNIVPC